MRMRWLVAGTLCATGVTWAGIAKYAGEFTALGAGGRALGMGGAFVAVANDVTAGYWNPAGLSHISYPQMMLMHDEQFGSLVNYDYGAVALPFGANTSLGLSVIRVGVDDIHNTQNAGIDANGNILNYNDPNFNPGNLSRIDQSRVTYFSAADWAFYFTYSRRESENFSYGANVKVIRRELGDVSATGIGFDVGIRYTPMDDLVLGANLQDVTTTFLAWSNGTNEQISPTMKLGTVYFLEAFGGRFGPAVDVDIRFENRQYASMVNLGPVSFDVHSGLEYQFKNLIALRAGYSDVKQMTFGAGVRLPKLNIDYSFARVAASADRLGDTHRVSLMFTLENDEFRRVGGF